MIESAKLSGVEPKRDLVIAGRYPLDAAVESAPVSHAGKALTVALLAARAWVESMARPRRR